MITWWEMVIYAFAWFLFMWLFRVAVLLILVKALKQMVGELKEQINKLKGGVSE